MPPDFLSVPAPHTRLVLYPDYLRTTHWISTRLEMLNLAGWSCARCGVEGGCEVHHRTYYDEEGCVLWRERPEHLIVLCRGCHLRYHEIERRWMMDSHAA